MTKIEVLYMAENKNYYGDETQYFECQCHDVEHTLRISLQKEIGPRGEDELYVHIFLSDTSFWRRLWLGIKYIFGHKSQYGHFTEFMMQSSDKDRLIKLLRRMNDNES